MRQLFTMDTHDYDPNGTRKIRPSVRAIIIRDGKVLMVHSYYYLCGVCDFVGQHLDDYEAEERFTPEFVTPAHAIETNRFHNHNGKWGIVQERECRVLELLMEEGYFQ